MHRSVLRLCCLLWWYRLESNLVAASTLSYSVTAIYRDAACSDLPSALTFTSLVKPSTGSLATSSSSSATSSSCQEVSVCTKSSTTTCTSSTAWEYGNTVFGEEAFVLVEKYADTKCKTTLSSLFIVQLDGHCVQLDKETYVSASIDSSNDLTDATSPTITFGSFSDAACSNGQSLKGITNDDCSLGYFFRINDPGAAEQLALAPTKYKASAYYDDTQCNVPPAIVWFKGYTNETESECSSSSCAAGAMSTCFATTSTSTPKEFAKKAFQTYTFVLVEYYMDNACTGYPALSIALLPLGKCIKRVSDDYVMLSLSSNVITLTMNDNSSCSLGSSITTTPSEGCKNQYKFTIVNDTNALSVRASLTLTLVVLLSSAWAH